jgi:hypothetical protein
MTFIPPAIVALHSADSVCSVWVGLYFTTNPHLLTPRCCARQLGLNAQGKKVRTRVEEVILFPEQLVLVKPMPKYRGTEHGARVGGFFPSPSNGLFYPTMTYSCVTDGEGFTFGATLQTQVQ